MRLRCLLASTLALLSLPAVAEADELATPCLSDPDFCARAPIAFAKELALPVQGGFDTGWVPQGSPLQVHLFANLFATTRVELAGELVTSWPEALTLATPATPGAGFLGMHYGVEIGAEAMVQITVLGQNYSWTGPIPYLPQFDFQVDEGLVFDPWAFEGVSVNGSTMEQTLAQVSAASFIGINIPGLDGGFELNVKMDLEASYRTDQMRFLRPEDGMFAAPPIVQEGHDTLADFLGGSRATFDVMPVGTVVYNGVLHLIPAFYIETIGPDFSIPIADIPIPFSIEQKDWAFDPVRVVVKLPDIFLEGDQEGSLEATPSIDLGEVSVGTTVFSSFGVDNVGEAQLSVAVLSGDAALEIAETALSVAPMVSGTVGVAFSPIAAGEYRIVVELASNDPDEPARSVEILATAIGPDGVGPGEDELGGAFAQGGGCACRVGAGSDAGPDPRSAGALLLALALMRRRRRPMS